MLELGPPNSESFVVVGGKSDARTGDELYHAIVAQWRKWHVVPVEWVDKLLIHREIAVLL